MITKSSSNPKKRNPKDIDMYLASLPENHRRALQSIREAVQGAVPDADEAFVYGVPGFKLDGKSLACYAGFKNHCGFYPMSPAAILAYSSELKDYDISEGTIRFQPEYPLSKTLVVKLVRARAAELRKGSA
jgi:uncharacterized protein YdhG (YjbR/CyaY superfamily)